MRALVTGAVGFVGRHLVRSLRDRQVEVCATDINTGSSVASLGSGVVFRECDIRDARQVDALIRETRPEEIYHLAAFSSPQNSFRDFKLVHDTNFWGTFNFLEAIRCAAPHARLLIVSSSHCYAPAQPHELPIQESHPFAPKSPYALSKASADLLGAYYHSSARLHVVRARPFNHTGPGQSPAFVCSDFARQIAAIELDFQPPELKVGNLQSLRDFSDVRDVVRAYELLLERGEPGEAYNVGSGTAVAMEKILEILIGLSSRPVRVVTESERVRQGEVTVMYGSISKLVSRTGYMPQIRLEQTLADILYYWRQQLRAESVSKAAGS
jgi:GDP-4-dehydro-6-deoxy-D-mannose reductase